MKRKIFSFVMLVLTFAVLSGTGRAQQNPLTGTWKQNMAKSKYDPANLAPRSGATKWEAVGADGFKWVADGVDAQGKPTHTEFSGKFDGKDYPVKGIAGEDTRAYTRIDDYTYDFVSKKAGKVTTTSHMVISRDGKTRSFTTTGTDAEGHKVNNTSVYEKQ
jgi:hypothetical protein